MEGVGFQARVLLPMEKFCLLLRSWRCGAHPTTMPRGRPPPGPTRAQRTNICQDSRAALARLLSEYPPDDRGFGAQVAPANRHDDELSSIFQGRPRVPSMANGGLTQEEADLRAVKMAVKRGPEQAVDQMMSMLARSVAGIAGIEASISQATAAARLARGMPERAATPQPVEEERVAPPVVRSPALPISPRVRPWTDAPAASPDAPGGMSLQRLLVSGDRDQVAAGPRQEDAASDALWPTISVAQIVSLMQGVRFFREADLPPECHAEVAGS